VSRFHLLAPSSALAINQTVNQNFPGARSATFLNANPRWVHHKAEVRAVGRISPFTEEIISPYGREFLRPIRLEPFLLPRHPWRLVAIHFLFHTFLYILIIKLFCDHDAKVGIKKTPQHRWNVLGKIWECLGTFGKKLGKIWEKLSYSYSPFSLKSNSLTTALHP
jgi:hypothetical protein